MSETPSPSDSIPVHRDDGVRPLVCPVGHGSLPTHSLRRGGPFCPGPFLLGRVVNDKLLDL